MNFYLLADVALLAILLSSVIYIFTLVSGYGGKIGQSFRMIGWGVILMGVSHFVETISTHFLMMQENNFMSLVYHSIASLSFVIVAYGFKKLMQE